ncbi:unnamed protein product [Closterium sp. NIES-65]|nr:unnamed protein product [Closterium sp. NIES-65]
MPLYTLSHPLPPLLSAAHTHSLTQSHTITHAHPSSVLPVPSHSVVSKNYWEGPIPKALSKLKKLKYLGLRETALEGEIPAFLGTLSQLTYLSLSDTRLYGKVPTHSPPSHCPLASFLLPPPPFLLCSSLSDTRLYGQVPKALSGLAKLKELDLSSNYLSGPLPAFLQRVKKVNAADNYFSGSASSLPCSDDFSVTGNCLSSVPSKCGGTAGQKTTQECNKFCGTATATGACSGKGVCVLDVAQLLKTQAYVPMCKCQSGYWASHQKLRCSKNNS